MQLCYSAMLIAEATLSVNLALVYAKHREASAKYTKVGVGILMSGKK